MSDYKCICGKLFYNKRNFRDHLMRKTPCTTTNTPEDILLKRMELGKIPRKTPVRYKRGRFENMNLYMIQAIESMKDFTFTDDDKRKLRDLVLVKIIGDTADNNISDNNISDETDNQREPTERRRYILERKEQGTDDAGEGTESAESDTST